MLRWILSPTECAEEWRAVRGAGAAWYQRVKRDERPSVMYFGKRGRGKSLALSDHGLDHMREGRVVIANYRITDIVTGETCQVFDSLEHMLDLIAAAFEDDQPFTLVIDEAQNIFDARGWQKTPRWFRQFLSELRHYKGCMLMGSQMYTMVEKRARALADTTYRVRPLITGLHHRIAFFRFTELTEDFEKAEEEALTFGVTRVRWILGRVFASYSTVILPSDDDVANNDVPPEAYERIRQRLVAAGFEEDPEWEEAA